MIIFGLLNGQITVTGQEDASGNLTGITVVNNADRAVTFVVTARDDGKTFTATRAARSGSLSVNRPVAFGVKQSLGCNFGVWVE